MNTRCDATQRAMEAKLTRLTHKIAIQLHLLEESYNIWSSRSTWPVLKLLGTPSYLPCGLFRFSNQNILCISHLF